MRYIHSTIIYFIGLLRRHPCRPESCRGGIRRTNQPDAEKALLKLYIKSNQAKASARRQ